MYIATIYNVKYNAWLTDMTQAGKSKVGDNYISSSSDKSISSTLSNTASSPSQAFCSWSNEKISPGSSDVAWRPAICASTVSMHRLNAMGKNKQEGSQILWCYLHEMQWRRSRTASSLYEWQPAPGSQSHQLGAFSQDQAVTQRRPRTSQKGACGSA